jgi:hypothetical protein
VHHQHEVRPRRDAVALLHGLVVHHARLKRFLLLGALALQRDLDQRRQPVAGDGGQLVDVEQRDVALHQPRIAQALDAAQTGGRRDVHPLGQGLVAQRGIGLQAVQQFEVRLIKRYLFHKLTLNEIKFNQQ